MEMPFLRNKKDGVEILLHVQPRASKSEVVGIYQDRLKIRIKAPPVDGKANKEICLFFAKLFGVAKSSIEVIRGESGRSKAIYIEGLMPLDAHNIIASVL